MIAHRLAIGLAAVSLLALSACGSDATVSVVKDTKGSDDTSAPPGSGDTSDTEPDITVPDSFPDITFPDITFPDITFPEISIPDISLPEGLSPECVAIATNVYGLATLYTGQLGRDGVDKIMDKIADDMPADLQDEVDLVRDGLGDFADAMDEFDGDLTKAFQDPEVQAAAERLDNSEFNDAFDAIAAEYTKTCPELDDLES